ncbi:MAG: DUF2282 domain-containing protein [Candidatus Competibacter denitrificans]|jgi:uncharacterized membrane protein|uniref:Signal peptide protein n=1 Tax=Candidatus Competibacter denitrificans Run_A_D11 TaxID=1400863 RepID=W6MDQ8_9GAMM|nr:DUF2282 domain-containing protein [Candidatus Competibacter denitrificans]CDI03288.1 putative signal peptide protein [Candidatus Competibacter denitrificans Run_A_D11]HRC70794.1 DUF2282 domain-containing protein [Candidatus Competibacter denitrificans]
MTKTTFSQFALAAAVAGALSLVATPALAAKDGKDQCYGVAKAGENDCASAAGTHDCGGKATANYDGQDWKYVAKGTCEKMGGQTKAFKGQGKPAAS